MAHYLPTNNRFLTPYLALTCPLPMANHSIRGPKAPKEVLERLLAMYRLEPRLGQLHSTAWFEDEGERWCAGSGTTPTVGHAPISHVIERRVLEMVATDLRLNARSRSHAVLIV
jgi:hypothetical protein